MWRLGGQRWSRMRMKSPNRSKMLNVCRIYTAGKLGVLFIPYIKVLSLTEEQSGKKKCKFQLQQLKKETYLTFFFNTIF